MWSLQEAGNSLWNSVNKVALQLALYSSISITSFPLWKTRKRMKRKKKTRGKKEKDKKSEKMEEKRKKRKTGQQHIFAHLWLYFWNKNVLKTCRNHHDKILHVKKTEFTYNLIVGLTLFWKKFMLYIMNKVICTNIQ